MLRLIGLVVVLAVLVALAPTLVSLGLGQGLIRAAAQRRINGQVSFDDLQLRWFSPQRIDGLVVTDAGGSEVARINGRLNAGLFALLLGGVETLEIDLSGRLSGELREDGSTSFQDLLARPSAGGRGKDIPARPMQLAIPSSTLRISGLTLELHDAVSDRTFVFAELTGTAAYRAGDRVGLELGGRVFADAGGSRQSPPVPAAEAGSINITVEFDGLFDKRGTMTPGLASGRLEVELRDVPVPLTDLPTVLQQLTLTATSARLTEQVDISIEVDAVISESQPGRLEGHLTLRRPVTADGVLDVRLDQLTGRVTGRRVPTALLQPFLSSTPIIASRDLGPTVDIDATFSAAPAPVVTIEVKANALQLAVSGTIDTATRALRGDRLSLAADVAPELFESLTGMSIDRRAGVVLDVDAFTLPSLGRDFAGEMRSAAARGTLKLTSPTAVSIPGAEHWTFAIDDFQLQFDTAALGERLAVRGSGIIEGAAAELDVTVTDLITESGWADADSIVPIGTASLRGVAPQLLARLWPQRAELIGAAGKGPIDVTVVTSRGKNLVNAQLRASRRTDALELRAEWTGDAVRVVQGRGRLTATPELMAALQTARDHPVSLVEAATVQIELEPFELRQVDDRLAPAGPIRALVTVPRAAIDNVPGFVEPLGLHDVSARLTVGFGEHRSIVLEGQTKLHRAARDRAASESLGDVQYTLSFAGTGDDSAVLEGHLESKNLWLARLEPMLEEKPRALGPWLGERGAALITFSGQGDSYRASIVADFPYLTGEFEATLDDRTLSVQGRTSKLALSQSALERRLAPKPAAATEGSRPPAGVTVDADVPLAMNLRSLRLPRAMLAGEPFDPTAVDLDITVTGGPFIFRHPDRSVTSLNQLKLTLRGQNLAEGISLSLTGRTGSTAVQGEGQIAVDGKVRGLTDATGAITPNDAVIDMTAAADGIASAAVDALAGFNGLLVAAVGERMDLDVTAEALSRNSGTLETRVDTPNGWLQASLRAGGNALRVTAESPAKAELEITQPFAQRLLYKIHPVLADIRSTEQPLRATISNAVIPLDGKVARLNADLEITIGAVEFDSGSISLGLLTSLNATNASTIPGHIEPIVARIRDGVVTYDRFTVKIDKYTLAYSGRIDLNTRTVDLRTELPLAGLAMSIKELRGYADKIIVPLVTRGQFGKLKTEIDPEFDLAGAAVEAGFRGFLNDILKDEGIPLGDILDDIFNPRKKKNRD